MKLLILLFAFVLLVSSTEILEQKLLDFYGKNTKADIIIFMKDNLQLSQLQHKGKSINDLDVDTRAEVLVQQLKERAEETQASLQQELKANKLQFDVMWNVNGLLVRRVEKSLLFQILSKKQFSIENIILNHENEIEEVEKKSEEVNEIAVEGTIESNIEWVKAPEVWKLGYEGQGILVGVGDTGLFHLHESLVHAYNGTIGANKFNHNYAWGDPSSKTKVPSDSNGHGTHCTIFLHLLF
jgi:bacillopeptidase F